MRDHIVYFILAFKVVAFGLKPSDVDDDVNQRIMKGRTADQQMFPFIASLWILDSHSCGATILEDYWILTAAHCLHDKESGRIIDNENFLISVGHEAYKLGYKHRIIRKIIHEGFTYDSQANDIALLKVFPPFKFDPTIQPVQLNPFPIEDYDRPVDCVVAGWGMTEETYLLETTPSETLRYAQVNTIPLPYCKRIYTGSNDSFNPTETNICVFTMVGRGTCIGDSGGPLLSRNQQVGILSTGGTCDNLSPEVYTRISSFYTWIIKALGRTRNLCLR